MRNFVNEYIVFFTVIYLLQNCSPECTHYYLVLKEYFDDFGDGLKPMVEPSSMKTIQHEYPFFNISNEFKELEDNKDCILELVNPPTCMLSPSTFCRKLNKRSSKMGTDVHYTTTVVTDTTRDIESTTTEVKDLHYTTTTDVTDTTRDIESTTEVKDLHYTTTTDVIDTTRDIESTTEVKDLHYTTTADVTDTTRDIESTTEVKDLHYTTTADVTDTTGDIDRSTPESTTLHYTPTTDVTDTSRALDSTSEETVDTTTVTDKTSDFTTSTDDTTTVDVETTTATYNATNGNAAELSAKAKKEVAKIVAISTLGATGTTALGYFITMKIKHMLQYGAYHLTESNPGLP